MHRLTDQVVQKLQQIVRRGSSQLWVSQSALMKPAFRVIQRPGAVFWLVSGL
ncbi:hypothetical protein [Streptomyces sp. Y7]|uniref:hypothetical protein n=1 Tax=Streptomyces sp. Y7 TaxID=3342392 RepID=UPI0037236346